MRSGSNAIEGYKSRRNGNALTIRADLPGIIARGYESMSAEEKDLLKWLGVFFRKPTPGRFMMRIRMPNGMTSARQFRAIADLSRRVGDCVVDVTTRQQIQLRGFTLGSIPEMWDALRDVDLQSLQTGMDNARNICGCPLAGLALNELFDASPIVLDLDRRIVGSEGNPEFANLPRKFNMVVTGCLENCTPAESQDLALVPALRSDRAGFNILVGGKMGSGGFTIASSLDVFVTEKQAAEVAAELIKIFRDHGSRDARSKCRFAFLVEEWGLARLRDELGARLGRSLERAGRDVRPDFHMSDHLDAMRQNRPGLMAVGIRVPVGRMDPAQMEELARLADEYGNGEIRLTMSQNAIIPNVPDHRLDALLDESLLQEFTPTPSPFRRSVIACTGTDHCNLAQIDTKRHAEELSTALEEKLGTTGEALSFHWSGCPAACGNHQAADIGFRGLKAKVNGELTEAVAIYINGRMGPAATAGEQIPDIVPCDRNLASTVVRVIQNLNRWPQTPEASLDIPLEPIDSGEQERLPD